MKDKNTFSPAQKQNVCNERFIDKIEKEITLKRFRIFLHFEGSKKNAVDAILHCA